MTYATIKEQVRDGTTQSLYVFSGEEIEVQNIYINRIAESADKVIKRVDTVAEALKFKGAGLLGKTFCFVCRDDPEFQKNEGAWEKIEGLLGKNTLVYIVTKLDKRSKFYSYFSGRDMILQFDALSEPVLTKHIKARVPLSTENCHELIRVCEKDYGRILNELDKISQYMEAKNDERPIGFTDEISSIEVTTTGEAFNTLMDDGTIYQPPTDAIFQWVDAVLSGKPKLAFKLLEECQELGEPSLRLLLVLYQGVRRLLQVQSCQSKDIVQNTGLTAWEVNLVKDKIGVYQTGELVEALRNIKRLETGIKTGEVEEEYAVPCAMVSLLSA